MNAVVDQLKKRDMLEFDDGRYIMWAPGIEIPLTVVKVLKIKWLSVGLTLFLDRRWLHI
jgi:hypothetical protein